MSWTTRLQRKTTEGEKQRLILRHPKSVRPQRGAVGPWWRATCNAKRRVVKGSAAARVPHTYREYKYCVSWPLWNNNVTAEKKNRWCRCGFTDVITIVVTRDNHRATGWPVENGPRSVLRRDPQSKEKKKKLITDLKDNYYRTHAPSQW